MSELREVADAIKAHDEQVRRAKPPEPQPCHECGTKYAGIACPICKTERPAWVALKNITAASAA